MKNTLIFLLCASLSAAAQSNNPSTNVITTHMETLQWNTNSSVRLIPNDVPASGNHARVQMLFTITNGGPLQPVTIGITTSNTANTIRDWNDDQDNPSIQFPRAALVSNQQTFTVKFYNANLARCGIAFSLLHADTVTLTSSNFVNPIVFTVSGATNSIVPTSQ